MQKVITTALFILLGLGIHAEEPMKQGRVNVSGEKEGIVLVKGEAFGEGGKIMNYEWEKDPAKASRALTAFFPASQDWKKASFTFTPSKDGQVTLSIIGAYNKDGTQTWTLIDEVTAEGTEIKNGGFESEIKSWTPFKKADLSASISKDAKAGSNAVKLAHDYGISQEIAVKGNQEVRISFWFKAAE